MKILERDITLQEVLQIVKYGISGVTGGVLQVIFLYIFVDWLELWYIYGVVFAYLVSLIAVFCLQKFWTFQDYSTDSLKRQSLYYALVASGALILNVLLMYILVDILKVWHIIAQFGVVGVVGVLSFLINKKHTFNN